MPDLTDLGWTPDHGLGLLRDAQRVASEDSHPREAILTHSVLVTHSDAVMPKPGAHAVILLCLAKGGKGSLNQPKDYFKDYSKLCPQSRRLSLKCMRRGILRGRMKVNMIMLNGLESERGAGDDVEIAQEGLNQHLLLGALNIY